MALEKYVAFRGPNNALFYAERITTRSHLGRREVGYVGILVDDKHNFGGGKRMFKTAEELMGRNSIWKFDGGRVYTG